MGNNTKSRKSIKEEYLKLVEKKKREYFKKNESVIFACDFRVSFTQKWKEFVLEEIQESKKIFPASTWPEALEHNCRSWKTVNDNKYRSNIVLFDYLQEHKSGFHNPSRLRRTIIKVPENIENNPIDFDAVSIFEFLNGHFDQSTHYIANMILVFKQHFCAKNQSILQITEEQALYSGGSYEHLSKSLMKEIKNFIMIVLQTMIYYYGGLLAKKMQENPSQMYDFILEKIISKEIHDILIHSYSISRPQELLSYKEKLSQLSGITCQDLQVNDLYCLDKMENARENGYCMAIESLKEINLKFTPMQKFEVISQTTDLICGSIDDYWKYDQSIDQEKLAVDGDNFLSIYIYIVIKSKVLELNANLWIIKQLGRKNLQSGTMGYFLTTLEACVLQLETLAMGY